jgi:hypothetical protein
MELEVEKFQICTYWYGRVEMEKFIFGLILMGQEK